VASETGLSDRRLYYLPGTMRCPRKNSQNAHAWPVSGHAGHCGWPLRSAAL